MAQRSPVSDNSSDTIRIRSQPAPTDIERFKQHVKQTGCPETYPLISTSQPISLSDAIILSEFQIDRKKRPNLDEAPCPVCSPSSPKFLAGFLVWFPSEMCIRAIGRECGRKLSYNWDATIRRYKLEQKELQREQFLEAELWKVPAIISKLEQELIRAKNHKVIWKEMRSRAPNVVQHLRSSMARGYLTIARKRSGKSGTATVTSLGASQYYELKIGSVSGQAAVSSQFNLEPKITMTINQLKSISQGDDRENTFLTMCDMASREKIASERVIKQAKLALSRLKAKNNDFEAFFDKENLDTINQWSMDENSPFKFCLSIVNKGKALAIEIIDGPWEVVSLTNMMRSQTL